MISLVFGSTTSANTAPSQNKLATNQNHPDLPKTAQDFTLADTNGTIHKLSSMHGKTITLFFFCGCKWCEACATNWGAIQRSGALIGADGKSIPTWIVFSGDTSEAKSFETKCALDQNQTVMLPAPDMHVALDIYHSNICPRVFIISPQTSILYTNDHADDMPRQVSAHTIVERALKAALNSQHSQAP